jgi:glycine/D-amino acid oxidase-like deaminating enzyme
VIVGAGVAGLSAAWELDRRGMHDFVVLELEQEVGGNARSGQNDVSAYPWAAHYVPVPDARSTLVRELFTELGVLRDGTWDERYLCFAPQERLFMHGEWHAGIEPEFALDRKGREDFRRFDGLMAELRATGEFTIPMELGVKRSSRLDRLTMADWLREHDLTAPALRWYVDYACRDDYGALARDTSAWAGVHYFASRPHDDTGPLTWPEGNGWIVKRLLAKLSRYVRTREPALRIARQSTASKGAWRVQTPARTYVADVVIFAAPSFLAPYLVEGVAPQRTPIVYSPWLTANITLEHWPTEQGGTRAAAPPAWDNVIYDSPALGYVVATHQSLRSFSARAERNVWTYYWSLADQPPHAGRELLLEHDWTFWRDRILADLSRPHPDIRECVSRIDIMRMGHAMVRPTVGFLSQGLDAGRTAPPERFYLANSDRSGLSLFEQAQYQGVTAARSALNVLS